MRHKPVPPVPEDLAYVGEVRAAVALVPRGEESCCVRLMDRAGVPAEDDARTWLTFLTALGLAEEVDGKYVRAREPADPGRGELADRFFEGVYGAREVQSILAEADGPLDRTAVFDAFREHVPRWERHRSDVWEGTWRTRVGRILEWGALLGAFERSGEGYTA